MRHKITMGKVVIATVLILVAFLCVYVIWYTLIVSFSNKAHVSAGRVWIIPSGFNIAAYKKLLADRRFFTSFFVSVKRTLFGISLNILLIIITAYPLCLPREYFKYSNIYLWFLVINMLFSGGLIPAYFVVKSYNLINSIWSLILPTALPIYNTLLMIKFFKNVPFELNEAAVIDGANPWIILFKIYVPISIPSIATLVIFAFVHHWNSYFDGLLYINDTAKQPLQTYLYQLSTTLSPQTMTPEELREASKLSDVTLNSAKVIIALIPIMIIYPFLQKYFVVGMTIGSVKG